jgi:hypothetical protein
MGRGLNLKWLRPHFWHPYVPQLGDPWSAFGGILPAPRMEARFPRRTTGSGESSPPCPSCMENPSLYLQGSQLTSPRHF